MEEPLNGAMLIAGGLTLIVVGVVIGALVNRAMINRRLAATDRTVDTILDDAKLRGKEIEKEYERKAEGEYKRQLGRAERENRNLVDKFERELSKRREQIDKRERKLDSRRSALDRKLDDLEKREGGFEEREREIDDLRERLEKKQDAVEEIRTETKRRCEAISGLTQDEAKKLLLQNLEVDVRQDAAALVRRVEAETREIADKKARQLITLAIQRCAAEQVSETSVSVVQLPSDDLKGRIIGREGRNIRALEAATGCNFIIDDTPEAVVLSCFDPIRREIARQTLERLVADGRIHPGRIEELVVKVERELNEHIRQTGEDAAFELGFADMHPELTKTMGRLKYRTSYGQNILSHSSEVARLCSYMASELGADAVAAKRAGFLHDIGKALTHDVEGTHAALGADLCKKHNEAPGVVHSIAAHHNEIEPRTIIAVLVQAADAISSARPGARRETLENYVKRLRKLEEIADGFDGVTKSYALQAGRELRIIVEPTEINDNEASMLARDISRKIEKEVQYPGQIKVTVCREVRATEYAK